MPDIEVTLREIGGRVTDSFFETDILLLKRNRVYILEVCSKMPDNSPPAQPTASGMGLIWSAYSTATNSGRITQFVAVGLPTQGRITVLFNGQVQGNIGWDLIEVFNVDLGSPVVDESVGVTNTNGQFTVPLVAMTDPKNIAIGAAAAMGGSGNLSPANGFTQLSNDPRGNTGLHMMSQWKKNDPDFTFNEAGVPIAAACLQLRYKQYKDPKQAFFSLMY